MTVSIGSVCRTWGFTASLSHSTENPCTRDHAASWAPAGSACALGSRSVATPRASSAPEERLVEHHLVVAGVVDGKPHIGQGRIGEMRPGVDERLGQQLKTLCGQRREQTPPIGEVMRGRGMRHTRVPGQLAKRHPVGAPLGHQARGLGQNDGPQIAMVIGRTTHSGSISVLT